MRQRRLVFGVLFILWMVGGSRVLMAQGSSQGARVRALNNEVLRVHALLQRATPNQVATLQAQASPIIGERAAALSALIEQDAKEALSLAFSADFLADLAVGFPQSASQFESHGVWQGPIEYYVIDDATLTVHRSIRRLTAGQEQFDIYFGGAEPLGLKSGDLLQVSGVRAGHRVAAAQGSIQGSTVAPAACTTTGVQNMAILLVTFPGVPAPNITPQSIYDIYFANDGTRSVDGFWKEASYNQTSAAGNVFGWYTLDASYTCDQYSQMRDAAIRAADADVNFPNYSRVVIIFPTPSTGCGWAGLGTLGCGTLSSAGDGSFTASTAWQLATYMTTRDQGVKLSTHENGHNLTLHHASSRDFGAEALGPLGAAGTLSEYGDVFSTMGSWNLGHYSAQHKVQLGWMTSGTNYQTVESNVTASLQPIEVSPPGQQAIKVRRGAGNDPWLWVEYRRPIGLYDSTLGSQVFSGALIHYQDSTTGTYTHLLDFTPATTSWNDPALAAGNTWTDSYSNVSVTVNSATSSDLSVTVNYGPVPCVPANPTVTLSPANPSALPGASVNYTVSVMNNDSSGCSASTFTLSSALPGGWPTSFAASSLTISPGQTASTTMTKTVPVGTTPATYAVDATAASGSYSGTGSANCTVAAPPPPLSATVSVPNSTYAPRSTVPITATVLSGGNPVSGATVVFTLQKPNGASTKTATTKKGKATWNYRLSPKDPNGSYSVSAQVTYGSQTITSNTASFAVQ